MKIILLIGAGSFIGGVCRYLLTHYIQAKSVTPFPLATLAVNIIGCFLIGAVFALIAKGNIPGEWRLFLTTGILGGFTTFSAFSLETVYMLQTDQYMQALLYIGASLLLGLLATGIGMWLVKLV